MRRGSLVLLVLTLLFLIGCTVIPVKLHREVVKTNEIFIDRVEVFDGLKRDFFTGSIKELGTLVNVDRNPRYQKLVESYLSVLKRQLEDEGFVVTNSLKDKGLLLTTKIADDRPTKGFFGYTLFGQGVVVVQIAIHQDNNLILSFAEGAPYSIFSIETQVKRLTPRIAAKIKENLLR